MVKNSSAMRCPYHNFHARSYFPRKILTAQKNWLQFEPIIGILFGFEISLNSQFNSIWAQDDGLCITLEDIASQMTLISRLVETLCNQPLYILFDFLRFETPQSDYSKKKQGLAESFVLESESQRCALRISVTVFIETPKGSTV